MAWLLPSRGATSYQTPQTQSPALGHSTTSRSWSMTPAMHAAPPCCSAWPPGSRTSACTSPPPSMWTYWGRTPRALAHTGGADLPAKTQPDLHVVQRKGMGNRLPCVMSMPLLAALCTAQLMYFLVPVLNLAAAYGHGAGAVKTHEACL